LRGSDLLDKQIAFDAMTKPSDEERDLRMLQSLCLEAALNQEFGFGQWQKALEDRKRKMS